MTPSNPPMSQSERSDRNLIITILGTGFGSAIAIASLIFTLFGWHKTDIGTLTKNVTKNASQIGTLTGRISGLAENIEALQGTVGTLTKNVTANAIQISALTGTTSELTESVGGLRGSVATLNQTVTENARRIGTHTGKISGLEGSIAAGEETSPAIPPTSDTAAPQETEEETPGSIAQVQDPFGAGGPYGAFGNIGIEIAPLSDAQNLGWFGWTSDTDSNFELTKKTILAALEAEGIDISNPLWFETPAPTVTSQGLAYSQAANKNTGKAADGHGVVYIPPLFGSPEPYEKFGDIQISFQDDAQNLGWFGWTSDTDSNFERTQETIRTALEAGGIDISNPLWFETPGPMAMNQKWILIQPAM